ncbi:MAG TPA: type II toxin-antitoxin system death-on-curing family toxin [Spirochaetaceae bacterium]|nr:type II toxin-antitoxin system death-on-curing family toxin [Spirochaetaceae bacterium]
MIRFDIDKIKLIHQLVAQETGGGIGVRDEGLLDSAIESIYQTFGEVELYPTKEEKGARLGFSLISNHAFLDGNKRVGMLVMLAFLELNGVKLNCTDKEIYDTGIGLASGKVDYDELLEFVINHKLA